MINKLYVFGNIGKLDQLPKSGGQSSARRVMQGFKNEGIKVTPIRRHRAELQSKFGHILEVAYFAVYDLLKMILKTLFGSRKHSVFVQMTYAGALVPYEFILSCTARILGYKCMEYLQGGLVMDSYPRGGLLHKWLFKKNIEMQSLVLFEGFDALKLTETVTKKTKLVYFPSYIFDEKIPQTPPKKPLDELNFCFFGRLNESKNILIIIEIYNLFCSRNSKKKTSLTLVGAGDNEDYLKKIAEAIDRSPYKESIHRIGNSPYDFLVQMMTKQHFYLFPTKEKAEGHSNALNEAMSQGVIPIACDYHFNKTVIGEDFLVVKGYRAEDYVKAIENVIEKCNMTELSVKMWQRVKESFAYSTVNGDVCGEIRSLM